MIQFIATSVGLFVALLGGLEAGRWLRQKRVESEGGELNSAASEGVTFAVLGLLIAFTFTSSASRFDERRQLIVEQANAIGTAWLRVDLLPQADREPIRRGMREWTKLTVETLPRSADLNPMEVQAVLKKAHRLQDETWKAAISAVERSDKPQSPALVLPPLNDWIDLSSTRAQMNNRGLPPLVMPTLVVLSLIGAMLAGFDMGKSPRGPVHMVSFAAAIAFSLYVINDLNHPRSGLIRVDAADDAMKQLYESMTADVGARTP